MVGRSPTSSAMPVVAGGGMSSVAIARTSLWKAERRASRGGRIVPEVTPTGVASGGRCGRPGVAAASRHDASGAPKGRRWPRPRREP